MLEIFDRERLNQLQTYELSDALECGAIAYFPESPVPLPAAEDLEFLRQELPSLIKLKNISFHPEAGRIRGIDTEDQRVV